MPNHARIAWTGDLWDENTVEETDESGATTLKLIDFEATCVCGAVQDLVHISTAPLVETYLRRVLGRQPTEDEVEALLLEARLAEHIHFYIHRPIFFDRQPAGSFLPHGRGLAAVAEAARASTALRKHVVRECPDQRACRPAQEASGQAWCWWGAEQLIQWRAATAKQQP